MASRVSSRRTAIPNSNEPAGVGERNELPQVSIVSIVGQVALGPLEQLEESALGIFEDRSDRNPFPSESGGGKRNGEALRGRSTGCQRVEPRVDQIASRKSELLEACRSESDTGPASRRGLPRDGAAIRRCHALGTPVAPGASVLPEAFPDMIREFHGVESMLRG